PPAVLALLGKRLTDARVPAEQRGRIVDILAASDDPESGKALLGALAADVPALVRSKVLENLGKFLPGKWAGMRRSPELAKVIADLMARPEGRSAALGLIAAAQRVEEVAGVRALVEDARQPAELRRLALRTLGKLPSSPSVEALTPFVTAGVPFTADALEA